MRFAVFIQNKPARQLSSQRTIAMQTKWVPDLEILARHPRERVKLRNPLQCGCSLSSQRTINPTFSGFTVDVYCAFCRVYQEALEELREKYPTLVFRDNFNGFELDEKDATLTAAHLDQCFPQTTMNFECRAPWTVGTSPPAVRT